MHDENLKFLRNKRGKILFVGTLRQIKRRLRRILHAGPLPWVLFEARQLGYDITNADASLFSPKKSGYNTTMDKLKEKLKEVPKSPGVYQFLARDGEVIYVGKAKDLRARLSQYLNEQDERPQIPFLLAELADFRYTVVTNELESLFLENTLIKERLPKYNIQLRDDKNYAFITIDYTTEIPQIGYVRKFSRQTGKVKYFGPYSSAWKIRNTLNLLRRIFPYCAASQVGSRPCFYYYLHRCPGVCIGKVSLDEYRQQLSRIESFLAGNTAKIRKELERDMKQAARDQRFETAARLRDQCEALQLLDERQSAILSRPVSWDIISLFRDQGFACINLFKIREGKMLDKENFVYDTHLEGKTQESLSPEANPPFGLASVLETFLEQYYMETSSAPREVFIPEAVEGATAIEELLYNRFSKKIPLIIPRRGKQVELIGLGAKNAEEHLKNWLSSQAGHLDRIQNGLRELQDHLGLAKLPERIECYDISNIQGTNPVGSMVVFKNGLPAKSEYRKFKITTKQTPDDFAMMKEMLDRRLARLPGTPHPSAGNPWPIPDLIVIDGGKGQLGMAVEMLEKHRQPDGTPIPVIGLAKRIEEIFLPGSPEPIILPHDNPGLQMLQRLRDEAHRFGITFHRELRSKQAVRSALDGVPGLGPKTKKLLKTKFGTVANIKKASLEELAAVIGPRLAETLKKNL